MKSNTQRFTTRSPEETRALGTRLGNALQPGDWIALSGELGAGKTTLVQGLVRAFASREEAASPTFVLATRYEGRAPLFHVDAYRLENADYETVRDTGILEMVEDRDAVTIIEWPEYIAEFLPAPRFRVRLEHGGETSSDTRRISIEGDFAGGEKPD